MTFLLSYDFSTLSEESHLENPQMNFFGIHWLYIQIDPISHVLHVSMIHAVSDSVAKF